MSISDTNMQSRSAEGLEQDYYILINYLRLPTKFFKEANDLYLNSVMHRVTANPVKKSHDEISDDDGLKDIVDSIFSNIPGLLNIYTNPQDILKFKKQTSITLLGLKDTIQCFGIIKIKLPKKLLEPSNTVNLVQRSHTKSFATQKFDFSDSIYHLKNDANFYPEENIQDIMLFSEHNAVPLLNIQYGPPSLQAKQANNHLASLYLKHLKCEQQKPSFEYLCELQKKHIETIPHENIDGIFNRHTSFDIPHLLNKFVVEKRGGLCFELNYAFAWLLEQLGFKVEMIMADVLAYENFKEKNDYPTHPILVIHLDGNTYLTDVGWSDSYRNPLALNGSEYQDHTGEYRVTEHNPTQLCMQKKLFSHEENLFTWHDQFVFDRPKGVQFNSKFPPQFLAAHAYTHVGKGYLFTNLFHFTKSTANGHVNIWDDRLLVKEDEKKSNQCLKKPVKHYLEQDFQINAKVAKTCEKPQRSMSQLFFYKPVDEDKVIEDAQTCTSKMAP